MICKKLIRLFICLGFILIGSNTNAQVALLQNTIDKLESYKNFSYQYVYKQKEAFGDTLVLNQKFALLKMANNSEIGYFYKRELKYGDMKLPAIDLYNGKNLMSLDLLDSTYVTKNLHPTTFNESLPAELNWLKTFLKKNPSKIALSGDTIINSINSYHLIFNTKDTIDNKVHSYVRIHLFIDKVTGLPVGKFTRATTADYGKELTNFYSEENYFNYKMDQDNINIDYFAIPEGFHPPKVKPAEQTALLTPGTVAPDWILYDTDDKKTSLAQMKGKVILLDFYFIGCGGCMLSLRSLDNIYEKYRNQNFVITSLTERDSKKSVLAFDKIYHIKYPGYIDASDAVKSYHVTGFPTFYFIDKEGKIASVLVGYSDNFEEKAITIIDDLLKR